MQKWFLISSKLKLKKIKLPKSYKYWVCSIGDGSPLPCPHGRQPIGDEYGRKHCPHCLGINDK
jgi:hypothetical protein